MFNKLIYPELSYLITGLCFQTHNELGQFYKEKQYGDRLEQLLRANKIPHEREVTIPTLIENDVIQGNIAYFIISGKIILELKAKQMVTRQDYWQVQRYLHATNLRLGLLVNFNTHYIRPKRVINTNFNKK